METCTVGICIYPSFLGAVHYNLLCELHVCLIQGLQDCMSYRLLLNLRLINYFGQGPQSVTVLLMQLVSIWTIHTPMSNTKNFSLPIDTQ